MGKSARLFIIATLETHCFSGRGSVAAALVKAFDFIIDTDSIPAANPRQCGNWRLNDLEAAKKLALRLRGIFLPGGGYKTEYPLSEE